MGTLPEPFEAQARRHTETSSPASDQIFAWFMGSSVGNASQPKGLGLKFQQGGQVHDEITPVMPPRVEVKLVRNSASGQYAVEGLRSTVKSITVLFSAVEINFHAGEASGPCQSQRTVFCPECGVGRRSKRSSKHQAKRGRFGPGDGY